MSRKCQQPACPWPAMAEGLCRQCLYEAGRLRACQRCGKEFLSRCARTRQQRFCRQLCAVLALNAGKRRLVGDRSGLYRLYVLEHRTTYKLASLFGISATTVRKALRRAGILVRPPGPIRTATCSEGCGRPTCKPYGRRSHGGSRRCWFHYRLRRARQMAGYRASVVKTTVDSRPS